jgi:hypothetical protein
MPPFIQLIFFVRYTSKLLLIWLRPKKKDCWFPLTLPGQLILFAFLLKFLTQLGAHVISSFANQFMHVLLVTVMALLEW